MSEGNFDQNPKKSPKPAIKRLEFDGKKDRLYSRTQKLLKFVGETAWRNKFKVEGLENIPAKGSAVLVINHMSHGDEMFLMAAIDRPMHFMGRQEEKFNPPQVKYTYPYFGVISSSKEMKGEPARKLIKQVDEIVKNGELICIFPEKSYIEEKSGDKTQIEEFAPGIIHIAKKYGLPIVPMFLDGTQNVRPHSTASTLLQRIHFAPVKIVIGKPIPASEIQNAEQVRQAIIGLKSQAS